MKRRGLSTLLSGLLASFSFAATAAPATETILAPGYGRLAYDAPAPGSYRLPVIETAADGTVLDSSGTRLQLFDLYNDKIVLLSFIYSTCTDVNGCPLATAVFHRLKNRLRRQPEIARQLRLLTLSFNPEHDTPQVMAEYGRGLQSPDLDWRFLTTASQADLDRILKEYHQPVSKQYDDRGNFTGTFSHVLRVYLIDRKHRIRNIYSVSFLHPDTLINDVKTLLLEESPPKLQAADAAAAPAPQPETAQPMLGLPPMSTPPDNPLTPAKIQLGKKLFFDRRLSLNDTMSCAMCHIPKQGFSNNEMATSVGIEGRTGRRNTPTLLNAGYLQRFFHDGREFTLEQQVWGPLLAKNEMGNPSIGFVVEKIRALPDYRGRFEQVFGKPVDMVSIGMAIASYERTLNSGDSSFDRWFYGKQEDAMTSAAKQGFQLFTGKAGCSACHRIGKDFALFTDQQLHNTGIGYRQSMSSRPLTHQITIAPGVRIAVSSEQITSVSSPKANDLGLYEITLDPNDRWKYKTPTLRNIAATAPYMHNGQMTTLEQVVRYYNRGGAANPGLSPLLKPLDLKDREIDQLVALLRSLTGGNLSELAESRFTPEEK